MEGGWFQYHNGYYYLYYSVNGHSSPTYAVGADRRRNVKCPYEKAAAQILHHFSFPGHCSVVHVPDSEVDVMVYHSWISGKIGEKPRSRDPNRQNMLHEGRLDFK